MKPIASTLFHRLLMPKHASTTPHPAILMLHGRGADEEDLLGVVPSLDDRFLIISARAPFPFPGGGYTWYEVGEVGSPQPEMFRKSYDALVTFLEEIREGYPVDPKRIMCFGFSMGTVMSYALALSHPELFRGVSANSGYLAEGTFLRYRWKDLRDTHVMITHGTQDPVIPVSMARHARDLFTSSTAQLTYREYAAAHHLTEESIRDTAAWMTSVIDI
jgi:phospholipase/carboxylesterase